MWKYFIRNKQLISFRKICYMYYAGSFLSFDHSWPLSGHHWSNLIRQTNFFIWYLVIIYSFTACFNHQNAPNQHLSVFNKLFSTSWLSMKQWSVRFRTCIAVKNKTQILCSSKFLIFSRYQLYYRSNMWCLFHFKSDKISKNT